MFSGLLKYILVATSMAPVLFTFWGVSVINDNCIFSNWGYLLAVVFLISLCLLLLRRAKRKLEKLDVTLASAKNADHNVISFLFVYLLPVLDIVKKGNIYVMIFILVVFFVIIISSNTYHFNPLLSFFGYRFYEITLTGNITYVLITKKEIRNTTDIKEVVFISSYMALDVTNPKTS
jgi:ABC-type xylose transport system permease subunit